MGIYNYLLSPQTFIFLVKLQREMFATFSTDNMGSSLRFFSFHRKSSYRYIPWEGFGGPKKDQIVVSPVKDCGF